MSKLETNTIDTLSGTNTLQVGDGNVATINLGKSGDTINIPSGATITNSGTANNFGGANTPLFRAYSSTGQTLSNGADTTIVFGAEEFDPQNTFASNTFTPGVSGKYFLKACVRMGNGADNGQNEIYLKKNSSIVAAVRLNNSGTGAFMLQISDIVTSDTNDAFTILVYQASGGNVTAESGSNQTWFTGFKLIE